MRLTCFIVEDEPLAMQTLMEYCADTPELELVGSASSLAKAETGIRLCRPQLIFLDLHLPDGYGFTLLPKLGDLQPLVIVTSGYRQYALEGFEHGIIDYLQKPVYSDRFEQAIIRIKARFEPFNPVKEELMISKVNGVKAVPIYIPDIVYVEANENYVNIITDTHTALLRATLKNVHEHLPLNKFSQISRFHIVSLEKILRIQKNTIYLRGSYELSLSTGFRLSFQEMWRSFQ